MNTHRFIEEENALLKERIDLAILKIKARIEGNRQAAINSPQCADWSLGVVKGLEIALEALSSVEK